MINFAFDKVITYGENEGIIVPYPNFYSEELYGFDMNKYQEKYGTFPIKDVDMDEEDKLFLNGRSICFNLNGDLCPINQNTVDHFINKNESFLYTLLIWNNDLFDKPIDLEIPEKVKYQIISGKCKIVIFYITEPWFMYQHCYEWLSDFSFRNNLTKDDMIFVSSNLISPEVKNRYVNEGIIKNNFTIIPFNYFFHRLWFFKKKFHESSSEEVYNNILRDNLHKLRTIKKDKHFLCFNRKPHDHRVAIYAEVMTNEKLKDKTIITLGRENIIGGQIYKEAIRRFIDSTYKFGHERLHNFIDSIDPTIDYLYDTESMDPEQSININLDVHHSTFCNIVTETLTAEDLIFFSEKIIKPIFSLQPFVLIGNRGSLKKLKEYGFKTFDKWWDESYDDEYHQKRFERIVVLLEEISQWDEEKISRTIVEMEEVLIHNFKMLLVDESTKVFLKHIMRIYKNKTLIG